MRYDVFLCFNPEETVLVVQYRREHASESKSGQHNQSTEPFIPNKATVYMPPMIP